jgi:hypothetical protein
MPASCGHFLFYTPRVETQCIASLQMARHYLQEGFITEDDVKALNTHISHTIFQQPSNYSQTLF